MQAGLRAYATGEYHPTFTQQGIAAFAKFEGASDSTAQLIGTLGDMAIGIAGVAAAGLGGAARGAIRATSATLDSASTLGRSVGSRLFNAAETTAAGAGRASQYGAGWQSGSLTKALERHIGSNGTSWETATGKVIYENPLTGRQVVVDKAGGYFRIFQPNKIGGSSGTYLNQLGNEVRPAMRTGSGAIKNVNLRDVDKAAWQRETHFIIEER